MVDQDALDIVTRFDDAQNAKEIDAVMAWMTPDCIVANTSPLPNGERFERLPFGMARSRKSAPKEKTEPLSCPIDTELRSSFHLATECHIEAMSPVPLVGEWSQ